MIASINIVSMRLYQNPSQNRFKEPLINSPIIPPASKKVYNQREFCGIDRIISDVFRRIGHVAAFRLPADALRLRQPLQPSLRHHDIHQRKRGKQAMAFLSNPR
jgi:hypothetical protein